MKGLGNSERHDELYGMAASQFEVHRETNGRDAFFCTRQGCSRCRSLEAAAGDSETLKHQRAAGMLVWPNCLG